MAVDDLDPLELGDGSNRMTSPFALPPDVELVRTTPTFDEHTIPAGLLMAHRIAEGVWGRLVVYSGSLTFRFEECPDRAVRAGAGASVVIPPGRPHHVELDGPVTVAIEFHRRPRSAHGSIDADA